MKIVRTEIYRFSLPFATPVKVGPEILHHREGFLMALTDDQGRCGFGEISPLPGFDSTTAERCLQDFPSVGEVLNSTELHDHPFEISAALLGFTDRPALPWTNHTFFGVESALLGLHLQAGGKNRLNALIPSSDEPLSVPVNGLFLPESTAEGLDRRIRDLKGNGTATIKVKIGRLPEEEEIRQIRRLAAEMGTGISLRLDGNRNLTAEAYRRYFEGLSDLPVEYVEEPLQPGTPERAGEVPWPLALDESLARILDPEEPNLSGLDPAVETVILKPGLLRGLHAMARLVRNAGISGIRTTLSSAFNCGITLATLAVFSPLAGLSTETVHGLDTLRYLAADVLQPSPEIRGGRLFIPDRLLFGGALPNKNAIRERVL